MEVNEFSNLSLSVTGNNVIQAPAEWRHYPMSYLKVLIYPDLRR